jgi:hypothetical protein
MGHIEHNQLETLHCNQLDIPQYIVVMESLERKPQLMVYMPLIRLETLRDIFSRVGL